PVHDPASKPSESRWRFKPFHLHLVATPSDWQIAHENRPLTGHDFPLLGFKHVRPPPRVPRTFLDRRGRAWSFACARSIRAHSRRRIRRGSGRAATRRSTRHNGGKLELS